MIKGNIKKEHTDIILLLIGILVLECIFFRKFLGNDLLFGDAADGLLNNMLTEHWFQVFCGNEVWNELIIFYPAPNVISYTDMDLGFVFPYIIFRILGINIFLSNRCALMLLHFFGSICLGYFLFRKCKCSLFWSVLGVSIFSYSGAFYSLINHSQLFAVSYIPLILLMISDYFEKIRSKIRFVYLTIAVLVTSLLFYTAFYVGYFFILFGIFYAFGVLAVMIVCKYSRLLRDIIGFLKGHIVDILYAGFLFLFSLIPFIYVYLPTMKQMGSREWGVVIDLSPSIRTLIDSSYNTVLYGRILARFHTPSYTTAEGDVNFSLFTMLLFVFLWIIFLKKHEKKKTWDNILLFSLAPVILFSIVLVLRVGNFSLWYVVWKFLPGASALRAMIRYYMFLHLPMGIYIAVAGRYIGKINKFLRIAVFGVILLGNMKFYVYTVWSASEEISFLNGVSDPPADCKYIWVIDRECEDDRFPWAQMKAWLIASDKKKYTINGYSGNYPENYDFLYLGSESSIGKALVWIKENDIHGLYMYDQNNDTWIHQNDIELNYTEKIIQED